MDESRAVERRKQELAAKIPGLRDAVAEATAWSQAGYSNSGIAKKMDVTAGTAKKYLDAASDAFNGILVLGIDDEIVDSPGSARRKCPVCHSEKVCSVAEAEAAHLTSRWGATEMLKTADRVCTWCHCVRVGGDWRRMHPVGDRARTISRNGNKSYEEAKESITGGITPGRGSETNNPSVDEDDDPLDVEW